MGKESHNYCFPTAKLSWNATRIVTGRALSKHTNMHFQMQKRSRGNGTRDSGGGRHELIAQLSHALRRGEKFSTEVALAFARLRSMAILLPGRRCLPSLLWAESHLFSYGIFLLAASQIVAPCCFWRHAAAAAAIVRQDSKTSFDPDSPPSRSQQANGACIIRSLARDEIFFRPFFWATDFPGWICALGSGSTQGVDERIH